MFSFLNSKKLKGTIAERSSQILGVFTEAKEQLQLLVKEANEESARLKQEISKLELQHEDLKTQTKQNTKIIDNITNLLGESQKD